METQYLHGFDPKEQRRLLHQARFLEPYVYRGIDMEFTKHCLEVGCGVGAQTEILCRRFPDLKIDGVDLSQAQLGVAERVLRKQIAQGRVQLFQGDAQKLSLKKKKHYDAAFLCWFLEHVPKPVEVLKRVRQHLKPGSKVYCSEVFNQTLFLEPYSPSYLKYWFEFNDCQWAIQGHPFIGAQLGSLLKEAGFSEIETEIRPFHFDSRQPEARAKFVDYFFDILLSAEKTLLAQKRVTPQLVKSMRKEVELVKRTKDSVFFYAFVRATARA